MSDNTIYYKFGQTWNGLIGTDPIVAFFCGQREYVFELANRIRKLQSFHTLFDSQFLHKPRPTRPVWPVGPTGWTSPADWLDRSEFVESE